MSSRGSVTAWIGQLQAGEETALARLHERYWPRLVGLARQRLKGWPGRACDEEDVAHEAFWSFYRRVRAGWAFRLDSRHDLLALLTHIVACKALHQIQHEYGAQKRGGGRVRDESALAALAGRGLEEVAGTEPTPLEQLLLHDCYQHYVGKLPDHLRDFATLHLAGCTHKEIAARMGCVERTVDRKMALVLQKWREMALRSLNEETATGAGNSGTS
jgi:DNA-directed RNA polymerase specialized sigma24 family protein